VPVLDGNRDIRKGAIFAAVIEIEVLDPDLSINLSCNAGQRSSNNARAVFIK